MRSFTRILAGLWLVLGILLVPRLPQLHGRDNPDVVRKMASIHAASAAARSQVRHAAYQVAARRDQLDLLGPAEFDPEEETQPGSCRPAGEVFLPDPACLRMLPLIASPRWRSSNAPSRMRC